MGVNPSLVARCACCGWCTQHTADTLAEILVFLRRRLIEHIQAEHADQFPDGTRITIDERPDA